MFIEDDARIIWKDGNRVYWMIELIINTVDDDTVDDDDSEYVHLHFDVTLNRSESGEENTWVPVHSFKHSEMSCYTIDGSFFELPDEKSIILAAMSSLNSVLITALTERTTYTERKSY